MSGRKHLPNTVHERQCRLEQHRDMERIRMDEQSVVLARPNEPVVGPDGGQGRLDSVIGGALYEARDGVFEDTRKLVFGLPQCSGGRLEVRVCEAEDRLWRCQTTQASVRKLSTDF